MDPKRPKQGTRKPREALIMGTFTLVASLLSAVVPALLTTGDAAPAAPPATAEHGPLAVLVRDGSGEPWTATRVLCRLTPLSDPTHPVDRIWSDADGRCLWDRVPPGQYRVAVIRPGTEEAPGDEQWGERLVTAPGAVHFVRATPYRTAVLTRLGPTPASPLTAAVVVRNPDDVPREVAVRCLWDEDRVAPYDAIDTTETLVVPAGGVASFPCGSAARPALAGRTLTFGYEVRGGPRGDVLTDTGWTSHRVAP